MANQLAMPESKEFPHKPTYDALYQLFGVLTGLLDWEVSLHFRGGLTVDQSVLINDSLEVIEDTILGSSGADTLTVQASSTFVNDVVIQGDLDVQGVFTMAGDLTVPGNLQVNGNTALGNAIGDTTLITGPATLNSTVHAVGAATLDSSLNVKGSSTLGDAAGDTVVTSGPMTVGTDLTVNGNANVKGSTTLGDAAGDTVVTSGPLTAGTTLLVTTDLTVNGAANVKGNTTLGDAEADTVTIVDWILKVTSNDLLFTDDGGGTVVKICDQSSTYQLDVAIGDFHVADDSVLDGDLTVGGRFAANGQSPAAAPNYTVTNLIVNRNIDPSVITEAQDHYVLATLIQDLINIGILS